MLRKLLPGALFLAILVIALRWYSLDGETRDGLAETPLPVEQRVLEPIIPPVPAERDLYVADISVHTEDELALLFTRVEQLVDRPRGANEEPLISVILHGPEVEFFSFENYPRYKSLVDRAARLAAFRAVEINICQTRMRSMGIAEDQVPAFLNQVPYGPGEVEKLLSKGYLRM